MTGTERKLDEARFFLEKLNVNDPYFDYYLSAFLNAARSTSWVMRHEFHLAPGWEDWFKQTSITDQERALLRRINDLRIESTKKSGLKTEFIFFEGIEPEEESYAAIAEIMKFPSGTEVRLTIRPLDEDEEEEEEEEEEDDETESYDGDWETYVVRGVAKFKEAESENSRENMLKNGTEYFDFLRKQVEACVTRFKESIAKHSA